ncbi:MAG TPA: Lrp/AsnC family transcriptional regulator, partial [Thermodesulfobacteriaceae bacterium]|nr:Lrp/AsnC family transcriptional regulator [Thermodesulfobacteriaceae bacterium]
MEAEDRKLLTLVQKDFPLVKRPYSVLAQALGLPEESIIARLRKLTEAGILRQIGAIFNPKALGYRTTLVAFRVPEDREEEAAQVISQHPGVSHNYLRDHCFNFWFTLAVPPGKDLEAEVKRLAEEAGAKGYLVLPIKRVFRIAVIFDLEDGQTGDGNFAYEGVSGKPDERTIRLVRATQEPLPFVSRPFLEVARKAE